MLRGTWDPRTGGEGEVFLHDAIQSLRDEVTGLLMQGFGGQQRSLSFVLAKLDEARHWALQFGEETHAIALVDRGPILKLVQENYGANGIPADPATVTTDTTDPRD